MYLCELPGSKFLSVTSSNVILYNDDQKWIYQVLEMSSSIMQLEEKNQERCL